MQNAELKTPAFCILHSAFCILDARRRHHRHRHRLPVRPRQGRPRRGAPRRPQRRAPHRVDRNRRPGRLHPARRRARGCATGLGYAVVPACASGAHAIGQAFRAIRSGEMDAVLAGGADAPLTFGAIRSWESMRVLAIDNEHPEAACRPFSADRKGLVLAEGAEVLLLESFESAQKRGQRIAGEILGFGMTSDAGHITDPSADGAARAIALALRDGGLSADDVGYINAHGTATRANDATETRAMKQALGEAAYKI